MDKKNIIIMGSTGMLGRTIKDYLEGLNYNIHSLNRNEIDLSKCSFEELKEKIEEKVRGNDISVLINCSGVIKQRNFKISDMIHVNSVVPHWVYDISNNNNLKVIHFTTDCVFDGNKGLYLESDTHTATDIYGKTKSMGEPENCTVIRTSIIGEEKSNKLSLLEWVKSMEKKEINGYKNHKWNGLTCLQIGKVINKIIEKDLFWDGVRHIHSNEVSKYDLVSMINELYELDIKITPMNDTLSVDRTLNSVYDIDKFKIPNLYKQIEETRDFHIEIRNKELGEYYDKLI